MKHTLKVTLFIVILFLIAQLVGLVTANRYIQVEKDAATGEITIIHADTVLGPPPEVPDKSYSFLTVMVAVLVGTALLLLLVKYKVYKVWKYWFLIAVWATMAVFLGVYVDNPLIVGAVALALAIVKVYKQNIWFYNLTEVMVYSGIIIVLLPLFNLFSAFALLAVISVYDIIAVWKTKHMVSMAEFQSQASVFAGLVLPYHDHRKPAEGALSKHDARKQAGKGKETPPAPQAQRKTAVLGGGDIAFPLLFSSTVMEHLILVEGITKPAALGYAGLISVCVTGALFLLLAKAKQDKFYPAMPFISAGCLAGYLAVLGLMAI